MFPNLYPITECVCDSSWLNVVVWLWSHFLAVVYFIVLCYLCFLLFPSALANNRRWKPGPWSSTKRPPTHRVGTVPCSTQVSTTVDRVNCVILFVHADMRMELYISGMHREFAYIRCTSWVQLLCFILMLTPMKTWTKVLRESGRRSGRFGL